ncbi:nucleotide sugar dehydrogenase [Deltaproteobacteria bacterium TL4]
MADKICVVGLGYVGLPLAVEFSKKYEVIGFDVKQRRVEELRQGHDRTREISDEELKKVSINYTWDPHEITQCSFIIVAVPTPVTSSKTPDLKPLLSASKSIAPYLKQGSIVVYESTVYPGVTEEECVPVLEQGSGLKCGRDFKVGYSPERINPGDHEHTLSKITKVVSGMDEESLERIAQLYGSIIRVGVFKATSIKVAEAAKVIENTQRDLNIALMNELALIFDKLHIRTKDVLEAAGTKWNFLKFSPGLVGGHCIGVDPYYLTHKSLELGYHPAMILAGRRINDSMAKDISTKTIRLLVGAGHTITEAKVLILGFTFKENIPDTRNTKVIDIYDDLRGWGCSVDVHDPVADKEDTLEEYGLTLLEAPKAQHYDAVILAVPHRKFVQEGSNAVKQWLTPKGKSVVVDIKSYYHPKDFQENIFYWSL